MSSDVSKPTGKSSTDQQHLKSPLKKEKQTEEHRTNGHGEDHVKEDSLPNNSSENVDKSSEPAKEKHKTHKANKSTKKEDSKTKQKSEKSDNIDRLTPIDSTKENESVESTMTATENSVTSKIASSNDQHEFSEHVNNEKPVETKPIEKQEIDSNENKLSDAKADNNDIAISENKPEENSSPVENLAATADEEMPSLSLVVEPEIVKSDTAGKVLKLKSSPLVEKPKASDKPKRKKKAADKDYQPIEVEIEKPAKVVVEPARQRPSFSHISGRRSFRTLPDLPPKRYQYEPYKQVRHELDTSSSSLNVTVGSEVAVDSSFSFFGFGKKREHVDAVGTENAEEEVEDGVKTPKRSRLDRSGLLSLISTPITILRSQFSKASMKCSPPNVDLEKADEDGVENVSVVDNDEVLIQKLPTEEFADKEYENEVKEDKLFDDVAEDALKVQAQTLTNQADIKRKGCNVM